MSASVNPTTPDEIELREGLRATILADIERLSSFDFKTVTTSGGRKGFRLEAAFWSALDSFCEREQISRAALLEDILGSQVSGEVNSTSLIRTYLVSAQAETLKAMTETYARSGLITALQQAPVAAFAMDRGKRMLQANREFLRVARGVWGDPKGDLPLGAMRLTLTTPVEDIFEALNASGGPLISGIQIEIKHKQHRANAKMVPVPGYESEAVVGYIVL